MAYGGNVNPPRNRKGEHGNPPPKGACARNLSRLAGRAAKILGLAPQAWGLALSHIAGR